jgi:hypothetical protein
MSGTRLELIEMFLIPSAKTCSGCCMKNLGFSIFQVHVRNSFDRDHSNLFLRDGVRMRATVNHGEDVTNDVGVK